MALDTDPSAKQPGEWRRSPMGAPIVVTTDGKRRFYRRPSGLMVDPNPYNLLKWKERQLVVGLLTLLDDHDIDLDDRDQIDRLISDAYDVADTSLAADRGGHVHLLTEHADRTGQPPTTEMIADGEALGIPAPLQHRVVEQWVEFRARLDLVAVHVELPVVNDEHHAAGTCDRIDLVGSNIVTPFGTLYPGDLVGGDIKTGSLTTHGDGHPKYWIKYGPQCHVYFVGSVPYDVDAEQRLEWDPHPPRQDIALLYHYDLGAAIDGVPVDWSIIPVNLVAAGAGVAATEAVQQFAKRRDVFGTPITAIAAADSIRRELADAESRAARREQLLERYNALSDTDQAAFRALGINKDDLDAVAKALDVYAQPRRRGATV